MPHDEPPARRINDRFGVKRASREENSPGLKNAGKMEVMRSGSSAKKAAFRPSNPCFQP
jgi:hypothetical protein